MIRFIFFAFCVLFVFIPGLLLPQPNDLKFDRLSMLDGLSNNDVHCIIKDSRGFMWFGTNDGLNKYDGYEFTVYKNNIDDPKSISGSEIKSILEDRDGNIWVGTERNGLNLYDRKKDEFTRFLPDTTINKHKGAFIHAIYEDSAGLIWIGTNNGLYNLDKETSQFTHYRNIPGDSTSLSSDNVYAIIEDGEHRFWVGTANGLNLLSNRSNKFTRYFYKPNPRGDNIRSFYEDRNGALWIGTYFGGLIRFNPEKNSYRRLTHDATGSSITNNNIFCLAGDGKSKLFVGTENGGLNILNLETETFSHYLLDVDDPSTISSNSIYSLFYSDQDMLWVGTFNGGINFSSSQMFRFRRYKARGGGLNNPYILCISEDSDNNLWIGTDGGGLNFLNRKTGQFKYYKSDDDDPGSISTDAVTAVLVDRNDNVWAGTYRGGLALLNKQTGRFKHFRNDPNDTTSLNDDYIQSLFEDSRGNLYVGLFTGLDRFDRKTQKFRRSRFVDTGVLSMLEDKDGNLWVGSYGGLTFINTRTDSVKHFDQNFSDSTSYVPSIIYSLHEDSAGNLWVGTTESLYLFDRGKHTFHRYQVSPEQPNLYILDIVEDDDNNLWIGGIPSIFKMEKAVISPKDAEFISLGIHDGIKTLFKSGSGEIVFGGNYGLNMFYPQDFVQNNYKPPVVFTGFKIFNRDVVIGGSEYGLDKHITEARNITLHHDQSVITFEFAALNYIAPEKNQYAFKMEGFEKDWNYVGNQRSATYTNLNSGEYRFKIKGSNNDGVWNENGAEIGIKIVPPWWRTYWAYTIYAIIFGVLLYIGRRMQLNKVQMMHQLAIEHLNSEKLEEVNRLKSRFFSNITHEFRTPLTLITGPAKQLLESDISDSMRHQCQIILRNSKKLYHLINQLLDLSRVESGHMPLQTRKVNIGSVLKQHLSYFDSLAELKKIRIHFLLHKEQNGAIMPDVYLDEDKFEKIIHNLLSNAIKFSPDESDIYVSVHEVATHSLGRAQKSNGVHQHSWLWGKPENGMAPNGNGSHNAKAPARYVEIQIKDSGIGIPEDCIGDIFNRFYQVDESHTKKYEGSGIGLSLTKELVELHYGTIDVSSKYGEGATFYVRLPLGKAHLKPGEIIEENLVIETEGHDEEEEHENGKAGEKSTRRKLPLVLIVEDNEDLRDYIRSCLDCEYRLIDAGDGEEGLRKAVEHIPDLVLSDVMMPGRDGFELCKALKTDEKTSHIPVILLTARASAESRIGGLETGADDYITKPFDMKELQVRIRNLIDQRKQLRLRYKSQSGLRPEEIVTTSGEEKFLKAAVNILEKNLSDPDFTVDHFAKDMALSRVQLYRKIRALTGQSTSEFIRVYRLNRASQLLKQGYGTISETAYSVGFNSPSYFYRAFLKHFGVSPSDYVNTSR